MKYSFLRRDECITRNGANGLPHDPRHCDNGEQARPLSRFGEERKLL
ncbi:hypothetical protein C791_7519 [Amycolatopsis azurea DSM 43854]|uniref:Uncharacterized protein n=1 Tax=Amycolatopsis azurea DSM 43854 TaxID=1238180 RepID=M2QAQ2_9PSEU|nr:hypothetical protein C791_7519 [Amycolatopsis azurea DSM 43854]